MGNQLKAKDAKRISDQVNEGLRKTRVGELYGETKRAIKDMAEKGYYFVDVCFEDYWSDVAQAVIDVLTAEGYFGKLQGDNMHIQWTEPKELD